MIPHRFAGETCSACGATRTEARQQPNRPCISKDEERRQTLADWLVQNDPTPCPTRHAWAKSPSALRRQETKARLRKLSSGRRTPEST